MGIGKTEGIITLKMIPKVNANTNIIRVLLECFFKGYLNVRVFRLPTSYTAMLFWQHLRIGGDLEEITYEIMLPVWLTK